MWVSVFILRTNCAMAHKRDRAMKTPTIEKQLRKLLFLVACVMKRRDKIFSCCFTLLCFFCSLNVIFPPQFFPFFFPLRVRLLLLSPYLTCWNFSTLCFLFCIVIWIFALGIFMLNDMLLYYLLCAYGL